MRLTQHPRRTPSAVRPGLLTVLLLALLTGLATLSPSASAAGTATTPPVVVAGCSAFAGARPLGTTYADARVRIATCGARPSFDGARTGRGPVVRPFVGSTTYYSGYQCIELVARYLKARFGALPGIANGAQAVDRYAAAYPTKFRKIANGTVRSSPRPGDVLSLSKNRLFNDVGHTGIVVATSVNSAGNGTIRLAEQNFGGTTGAKGYHRYTVTKWRVAYAALPHIKWLRAR